MDFWQGYHLQHHCNQVELHQMMAMGPLKTSHWQYSSEMAGQDPFV